MREAEWESGMGKRIGERRRGRRGRREDEKDRKGQTNQKAKNPPQFPAGDKGLLIKLTDGMYVR